MEMNTITPRLRNSSIIGKRFSPVVDPLVKKHLLELNSILGKPAFSELGETRSAAVLGSLNGLKKELETAKEEANSLEEIVQNLEAERAEVEERHHVAHKEVDDLLKKMAKSTSNPGEKKLQTEQLSEVKKVAADLKRELIRLQKKSDAAHNKYSVAREAADSLSDSFVKAAIEKNAKSFSKSGSARFDLETELLKPIYAKKTESDHWDNRGILNFVLASADDDKLSIAECIDKVNVLSNLKNDFKNYLNKNWNGLPNNQKALLHTNYGNILDYLIAFGYWVKGISEVNALYNFITSHVKGANAIHNYLVVSAARAYIQKNALKINPVGKDTYNDDSHPLIVKITAMKLSVDEDSFSKEIEKLVKSYIADSQQLKLIDKGLTDLKIDDLPEDYYPLLVQYIRKSKVKIDEDNISYFLGSFINEIKGLDYHQPEVLQEEEFEQTDEDFDVDFSEDVRSVIKANTSNVKCAAQLFSSAIMEMDLDIFNLTNYLTDNFLIKNRIDIDDQRLRKNLQMFVFSNQFIDGKTGKTIERTKDGERNHFYRQVLNIGTATVPQGMIINTKFARLWKKLTPAVQDYVENASSSLQSDTFVSRGGVMQVVSGLQNNLSDSCTGMAKIISPIINAEWNFIKDKILGHPEIVKQISPTVGTWKGVAQTLFASMKHSYTDASLVYQKANICNKILKAVAEYDAPVFEQDDNFIDFCSMVIELDELIQSMTTDMNDEIENGISDDYGRSSNQDAKTPQEAHAGGDEWDF
ncbi:MAG: hypothetical protein IPL84_09630 [Chitinophagaceae bacterium]|nr:hypothetical protein [Chitinophagaceae bacterium]